MWAHNLCLLQRLKQWNIFSKTKKNPQLFLETETGSSFFLDFLAFSTMRNDLFCHRNYPHLGWGDAFLDSDCRASIRTWVWTYNHHWGHWRGRQERFLCWLASLSNQITNPGLMWGVIKENAWILNSIHMYLHRQTSTYMCTHTHENYPGSSTFPIRLGTAFHPRCRSNHFISFSSSLS